MQAAKTHDPSETSEASVIGYLQAYRIWLVRQYFNLRIDVKVGPDMGAISHLPSLVENGFHTQ